MTRLLCTTRYGMLGASSRLRIAQYIPYLRRAGLHVQSRAFLADSYVRALYEKRSRLLSAALAYSKAFGTSLAARRADILWIEKELLPWMPWFIERAAIGPAPYILDFDDAWSLRYEASPHRLVRWALGRKFEQLLRNAALIVTANETLYNWARSQSQTRVIMLPTVIDLTHYKPLPTPSGAFTIGWIGTPLTAAYLDLIAEPLRRLAAEAPLKLRIIGALDAEIPGVPCENFSWSADTEAALIGQCHAGIMPLPNDNWANGKSGYKLIQYMAMQRPAVGSAVGANNQIVLHGETGFLARTQEDWVQQLRTLRDDPALAQRLGAAGRQRVEQNYCLDVTAPVFIGEIRKILGNSG